MHRAHLWHLRDACWKRAGRQAAPPTAVPTLEGPSLQCVASEAVIAGGKQKMPGKSWAPGVHLECTLCARRYLSAVPTAPCEVAHLSGPDFAGQGMETESAVARVPRGEGADPASSCRGQTTCQAELQGPCSWGVPWVWPRADR